MAMEVLAAFFGVSLVPWTFSLVRAGRLLDCATVVLVAGVLFGPAFFAIEAGIQLSLDRLLLVGLLGLVAVRWRLGEFRVPPLARTDWLLVALAGWLLVRAVPAEAVPGGTPPLSRWLAFVAMPLAMYAIARIVPISDRDVRRFLSVLIGLGVYLAATALLEVSGLHALVFPRYIVDPAEWEFFGRGRGPFLNPVGNGMAMTACWTAAVCRFVQAERRSKFGWGIVVLVLAAGIVATLTRSVWLGAILAGMIAGGVFLPRWVQLLGLCAGLLIGGFLAMGLKDELLHLSRDKNLTAADAAKSVELRPLLAMVAWEMFQDRPVTGHGYGGYMVSARPYHTIRDHRMPLETARPYIQHNVFLSILVEAGLLGLLMLLVWGVIVVLAANRLIQRTPALGEDLTLGVFSLGFVAAYVANGMFHDVSVIPMMHALLFFSGGIIITRRARCDAVHGRHEKHGKEEVRGREDDE